MFHRTVAVALSASLALLDWASRSAFRALLLIGIVSLLAFLPGQASLPVTDRDEGRYVLATKQMFETGDFIDIRNQEEPRHKQPAGIYWLQSLAVAATGQGAAAPIGTFRLASLAGATAAAMLAWWSFLPLVGRRAALTGSLLLAATLMLGFEARIAKTDAAMLATVVLGTGVLLRAFLDPDRLRASPVAFLFWVAIGLGVMIKGPIPLMALGVGAAALCLPARSVRWLGALRPGWGIPIALAIALPWYVAIGLRTEGAFFAEALGWNALGKVGAAHEGHGGPPGYHFALLWFVFWPAAPLLGAMLGPIRAMWRRREVQALLCLVVPLWLVFEIVATKLPHYVLPTYPALAMLVALALGEARAAASGWWSRLVTHGFWLMPAGLLIAGTGASIWFEGRLPVLPLLALAGAVVLGAVATAVARRAAEATVPVAVATALATWLGAYPMIAQLDTFWPSERMAAAFHAAATCPEPRLASAGYHEPSFVFLTRTDTRLVRDGAAAADFLAEGGCRFAFVDAAPGRRGGASYEADFLNRLAELGRRAEQVDMVEGRNLNGARLRRMGLWRLAETAP